MSLDWPLESQSCRMAYANNSTEAVILQQMNLVTLSLEAAIEESSKLVAIQFEHLSCHLKLPVVNKLDET